MHQPQCLLVSVRCEVQLAPEHFCHPVFRQWQSSHSCLRRRFQKRYQSLPSRPTARHTVDHSAVFAYRCLRLSALPQYIGKPAAKPMDDGQAWQNKPLTEVGTAGKQRLHQVHSAVPTTLLQELDFSLLGLVRTGLCSRWCVHGGDSQLALKMNTNQSRHPPSVAFGVLQPAEMGPCMMSPVRQGAMLVRIVWLWPTGTRLCRGTLTFSSQKHALFRVRLAETVLVACKYVPISEHCAE